MLYQWVKVSLLAGALHGLCPSVQANTTEPAMAAIAAFAVPAKASSIGDAPPILLAQTDLALPPAPVGASAAEPEAVETYSVDPVMAPSQHTRIALLLPLRSQMLGRAAVAVRSGFQAAYDLQPTGVSVTLIGTDDDPANILSAYTAASERHDIVVGPLSRSGVTAVARSGAVTKPTIALNTPDDSNGANARLPSRMLAMGLSVEDESRQVAGWANTQHPAAKAYVVHTDSGWQRRAAAAFAEEWRRYGRELEVLQVDVTEGFLHGASLEVLRQQLQAEDAPPALLFAALDAWQTRQLRESVGRHVPLYGTSQLNPVALANQPAEGLEEMDGAHLLDIPWQLQPDHPAVMAYQRSPASADPQRGADLERLYALGIDAYRVARAIAAGHTAFELDGVTGKLIVRLDGATPYFGRVAQQAVYQDGSVIPADTH